MKLIKPLTSSEPNEEFESITLPLRLLKLLWLLV